MRCDQARKKMWERLDGHGSAASAAQLDAHLTACASCAGELRAMRKLVLLLGDQPVREVGPGFDAALAERLRRAPQLAWYRTLFQRLDFRHGRTLRPGLLAASGLAVALSVWALLPAAPPVVAPPTAELMQVVRQHEVIAAMSPEQELVEYSINQSTHGSVSETN